MGYKYYKIPKADVFYRYTEKATGKWTCMDVRLYPYHAMIRSYPVHSLAVNYDKLIVTTEAAFQQALKRAVMLLGLKSILNRIDAQNRQKRDFRDAVYAGEELTETITEEEEHGNGIDIDIAD